MRRIGSFTEETGKSLEPGDEPCSVLAWVAAAEGDLDNAERLDPKVYGAALELKSRGHPTTYADWLRLRPTKLQRG